MRTWWAPAFCGASGLLSLAVLGFAALGPRYGGEAVVGVLDAPPDCTPTVPRTTGARLLSGLVHETLFGVDSGGFPTPGLVASWTSSVSGREWTLTLRQDVSFHDGRTLSSDDAARSLRRFLRSDSPAAVAFARQVEGGMGFRQLHTEELAGVLTPDPARLLLRLQGLQALPFAPLAAAAAAVTSPRGAGCGPFVPNLPVDQTSGYLLTAFSAHWRGRPLLDRVRLVRISDPEELRSSLESGRVQVAPEGSAAGAPAATLLLELDATRPPFSSRAARSSVAASMDRVGLVRHFLAAGDVRSSLLPPSLLPPLGEVAPPRATLLSAQVVLEVSTEVPRLASQRVVAHLTALGLQVRVWPVASIRRTAAHARLSAWVPEVPEAGLALSELQALAGHDPEVARWMEAAWREPHLDRRRVLQHRAERALLDQGCLVALAGIPVSFAAAARLHGLRVDASGRLILEDAWWEP